MTVSSAAEDGVVKDDWRMNAACQPFDSELFFPDRSAYRNNEVARAKAVCRGCPVREECLKAAMDGREKLGIWGGLTPEERAKLQRRNRRSRTNTSPPKERSSSGGSPVMEAGRSTREQIRRGVTEGRPRIGPARRYAAQQT